MDTQVGSPRKSRHIGLQDIQLLLEGMEDASLLWRSGTKDPPYQDSLLAVSGSFKAAFHWQNS